MVFSGKFIHINELRQKDVMNAAFLSLGGNLNDRLEIINAATEAIGKIGTLLKTSAIYETAAWGSKSEKKYLNRVVKITTSLSSAELLAQILLIEKQAGRKRKGHQYSDRILDIDILFFNDETIKTKNLTVPHPRLQLRKFVLVPLCNIDKKFKHPVLKKSMQTLLSECGDDLRVAEFIEKPKLRYVCIEGNIGSGKSTLAKALSKKWGALFVPEVFEQNHLLQLFYNDPRPYAFSMENAFMVNRFQQITDLVVPSKKLVVSDYSFFKGLYYAKMNLPENEYKIYKKHYKTLLDLLPQPDLIIYLETSTENLLENIEKRGRPYEQNIKHNYLTKLEANYKTNLLKSKTIKKLVIPVKKYYPGLTSELIKNIEKYVKENFGTGVKKTTFSLH